MSGEGDGCICQDCGRAYRSDLLVPDDVWEKISPAEVNGDKGGGLLCPTCIVDRMVDRGITTVVHGTAATAEARNRELEAALSKVRQSLSNAESIRSAIAQIDRALRGE